MRLLALVACLALVRVGVSADGERMAAEPFNGAVHSDPGADVIDDGMTEPSHAVRWMDVEVNAEAFVTRKSWQPPQYHLEDGTHVRMRGWVSTIRAAATGEAVFRLPEEARPGRVEPWRVTMKGTDREILLGEDGVARLLRDIPADNWLPLAGFAFNSWRAGGADAAPTAELGTGSVTYEEVEVQPPKDEL